MLPFANICAGSRTIEKGLQPMASACEGLALCELAAECGVGIGEACDRAGIARSTPPRWKAGTRARPAQVTRLRQAILAIARERGSMPEGRTRGEATPETEPIADAAGDKPRGEDRVHAEILRRLERIEGLLLQLGILAIFPLLFAA
jgi:hypothetical protein